MNLITIIVIIISGSSSIVVVIIVINVIVITINMVKMRVSVFAGDIDRIASYCSFCAAYTFSIAAVAITLQTSRVIFVVFKDLFHLLFHLTGVRK